MIDSIAANRATRVGPRSTVPLSNSAAAPDRRFRWAVRAMLIGFGLLQVWAHRHVMGVDGRSYLDVADAYLARDWGGAINAYWSPLYSWLLGAAIALIQPTPYLEFAVVHAVNFVIFLVALLGFLSASMRSQHILGGRP